MYEILLWIPLIMVSAFLQPCIRIMFLESWLQIKAYGNVLWGINIGSRLSCMISIMWALCESSHIMRKTWHNGFDSVSDYEIHYPLCQQIDLKKTTFIRCTNWKRLWMKLYSTSKTSWFEKMIYKTINWNNAYFDNDRGMDIWNLCVHLNAIYYQ